MRHISSRRRAENEPFAPDSRPDAASFVYCVGCGKKLGERSGLLRGRGSAINIHCANCQGKDPDAWGEEAPITFCFRCGTKHVRYIELEPYRTIHSICPRCRPERAQRYASGDFAPLPPPEEVPEEEAAPAEAAPAAATEAPAKGRRKKAAAAEVVEASPPPVKATRKKAPAAEVVEASPLPAKATRKKAPAAELVETPPPAKATRKAKAKA